MTYQTEITYTRLREGSLLGTVAHAIWIVDNPLFAYEQSWDGQVYNVSDSMGSLGSVAFSDQQAVGVFFDAEVAEHPTELAPLFEGMPAEQDGLKEEALQYMYQSSDRGSQPMATSALWTEEGMVVTAEPWKEVYRKGAHLLRIQLMQPEQAYAEWKDNYGFSPSQIGLLKSIYMKRIEQDGTVTLDDKDVRELTSGNGDGLAQALELLESIDIFVS